MLTHTWKASLKKKEKRLYSKFEDHSPPGWIPPSINHCSTAQKLVGTSFKLQGDFKSLPLDSSLPPNRIWNATAQIAGEALCFSDSAHNKPLHAYPVPLFVS